MDRRSISYDKSKAPNFKSQFQLVRNQHNTPPQEFKRRNSGENVLIEKLANSDDTIATNIGNYKFTANSKFDRTKKKKQILTMTTTATNASEGREQLSLDNTTNQQLVTSSTGPVSLVEVVPDLGKVDFVG